MVVSIGGIGIGVPAFRVSALPTPRMGGSDLISEHMTLTIKNGSCLAQLQETCAVIGLCFRNFGEFLTLKSEKGGWALWLN